MANTFKFGNGNWAVKDGYALAYNDENNNFKPLPFDFTRASSATRVNKQGLVEVVPSGKPRIDFLDNTSGHLLLEPSRSNLVLESENFNNYFTKISSATITSDDIIAPDGSQNGDKLTKGTANLCLRRSSQVSVGVQYTFSVYAKKGSVDKIQLDIGDAGITEFTLTDEWQRFEVTVTPPTYTHIDIEMPTGSSGDYIYLFGAQVEQGSTATSYIPTEGSTVTRVAETTNATLNTSVLNNLEGTIFIDVDYTSTSDVVVLASPHDSAANKRIEIWANGSVINGFIGGSANIAIGNTTLSNGRHKIALAYKSGDSAFYVNGSQIGVSSTSFTISSLTKFSFNSYQSLLTAFQNVNEAKIYNTRLTNTELQNLTS